MKNFVVAVVTAVMVVGVAKGMPIDPEPRQFVYQPGSPSVRLYPVHFENYVKASPGRVHMLKEGSLVMQAFRPNMLQLNMAKTERPHDHTTTAMMTEMKSTTTTTTTTTMTMEPIADREEETTLQPHTMVEEDTVPQDQNPEPVTEAETMLEGDFSAFSEGNEVISATEIMPMMEVEEVEAATEISHDESETMLDREILLDDTTVTESDPENEMTTEIPNLRELEVF